MREPLVARRTQQGKSGPKKTVLKHRPVSQSQYIREPQGCNLQHGPFSHIGVQRSVSTCRSLTRTCRSSRGRQSRGPCLMPVASLPYADPILPAMCAGTCESRGPFVPRAWWLDQSRFPGIAGTGCQQPRPRVEHQARSNGIRCAGYRTGHTRAGACATFSRDKASFDRVPRKRQRAIRRYLKICGSSAPAVAS